MKQELEIMKQDLEIMKQELNTTKQELEIMKQELEKEKLRNRYSIIKVIPSNFCPTIYKLIKK
jgi:hypothetical protein